MDAEQLLVRASLVLVAVTAAAVAAGLLVTAAPALSPRLPRPRRGDARDARGGLRIAGAVAVALGVFALFGSSWGPPLATVAAVACWWATGRMEPAAVRRRREHLAASVPHAVDLLAACLAAGLSPGTAVEQVASAVEPPLSDELEEITSRLRLGVDPSSVWRDLSTHPQLGALGRTVARATESGASVSEAMLRLAEDLRRRHRAETETKARAVGVQAALPLGGCLLPAFVLIGVVPLVAGSLAVFTR